MARWRTLPPVLLSSHGIFFSFCISLAPEYSERYFLAVGWRRCLSTGYGVFWNFWPFCWTKKNPYFQWNTTSRCPQLGVRSRGPPHSISVQFFRSDSVGKLSRCQEGSRRKWRPSGASVRWSSRMRSGETFGSRWAETDKENTSPFVDVMGFMTPTASVRGHEQLAYARFLSAHASRLFRRLSSISVS